MSLKDVEDYNCRFKAEMALGFRTFELLLGIMTQKGVNRANWSAEMVHIRCLASSSSRVYPSGLVGGSPAMTDLECLMASNDLTCKMCRELVLPLTS